MTHHRKTSLALLVSVALLLPAAAIAQDAKMKTFPNAQATELDSLGIKGVNAFLSDIVSSGDPDAPITCGLFRMAAGDALDYTYSYDEAKFIIDGEMTLTEEGGDPVHVKAGDVVYFDKGAKIRFSSKSSGLAFYCGQRALGEL